MKKAASGTRGVFEKAPGSGEWWIRFVDEFGRVHRKLIGGKAAAEEAVEAARTDVRKGEFIPRRSRRRAVLFREIGEDAIRDVEKRYRRPSDEVARLRLLIGWFGDHPAESILPGEIEAKLNQAAGERRWAASTVNHHRSLMSLAYRLGRRNRKVSGNPIRDVPHKREDNSRVRELRPEEEGRLLRVIRARFPWHEPEFHFARHTGLRQGSQYSLTWEMVDWEFRMLHIPRSKNEEPLHVPLNEEALAALRVARARGDGTGRVFRSEETGKPLGGPKHWFPAAVREARISDFHWHDLRHDFATRLRRSGVALEDIADLLGHKTLLMTKRYAHISMDRLRDAVSRLARKPTDTRIDTEPIRQPNGRIAYTN